MVGHALKGESLVPLEKLEVNNIHSVGGCVVLDDAARRYRLPALLSPLPPRSAALVQAMIFGGLLYPPSVAPFYVESRTARLAMFCGLDPDKERFDLADLTAALRDLDDRWTQVCALLIRPPHAELRAVAPLTTSRSGDQVVIRALGMDVAGIPVTLAPEMGGTAEAGLPGLLQQMALQSKTAPPLLTLDEETAARMNVGRQEGQPCLIELAPESLGALLRQLNQAQLLDASRGGRPVEVRHHGDRYILAPAGEPRQAELKESPVTMGSLKELTPMTAARNVDAGVSGRAGLGGALTAGGFQGVTTNVPAERLPAATAMEWINRARMARAAFLPVQIVMGRPGAGEGVFIWRNHQNLQFLTHRLRCHLHAEWRARGESRPVEEVLRDFHEVHRATLTVDGLVVRRLATNPTKAVAALLTKLNLWELFESAECGKR